MFDTYSDLEQLDGVISASSEAENNPLTDQEITIFLNNDTRVISSISVYGQGLEASLLDDNNEPSKTIFAKIYHEVAANKFHKPDDKFGVEENGNILELTPEGFVEAFRQIVGPELLDFLSKRHEQLAFATKVSFEKAQEPEDVNLINHDKPSRHR